MGEGGEQTPQPPPVFCLAGSAMAFKESFLAAALQGDVEWARDVLANDPLVLEVADPLGRGTALICASQHGHDALVRVLVEAGAALDTMNSTYGVTALLVAAVEGHEAVVRVLVEAGAALDTADSTTGNTALMLAAHIGLRTFKSLESFKSLYIY